MRKREEGALLGAVEGGEVGVESAAFLAKAVLAALHGDAQQHRVLAAAAPAAVEELLDRQVPPATIHLRPHPARQ